MIRSSFLCAGACFAILLLISFWSIADSVTIGGNDDLDGCPSLGLVSGFKSKRNGFLAVRTGPNAKYAILDKLNAGQKVFICDTSKDGNWFGIVYSHRAIDDCGVSSPINPARPYKGKCKSGWVNARWIKVLAG